MGTVENTHLKVRFFVKRGDRNILTKRTSLD